MPSPKLFAQDGTEMREFTTAEYAQRVLDIAEAKAQADALASKAAAREALLDRLGITADEATLLLG